MSELPKGWELSTLADIASVITGNTPKKTDDNYGGEYAYYKPADLDAGYHIKSTSDTLTNEGMANARFIPANSTLVTCIGATIGKTGFSHSDGSCNQQINALVPMEGIDKSWLYFMMCSPSMQSKIKTNASSTTLPILNKSKFSVLPIVVAPLAEQKRIVEKLDEVLAQVDTIKARLDGIPALLKRFRQSVLASAVSGKLTEEWREENKPTYTNKEFRDSITEYRYQAWLNEKTKKYEEKGKFPKSDSWKTKYVAPTFEGEHLETLPDGWIQDVLEGLVYISARIGWKGLKASEYTEEGPLFLSVHGLNHGTYVELSEAFHISEERYLESPEIMLKNDDILLCKDGAGIGKIAIVKGLDEKASINSSLLLIRAGKFFDTKFLYYLLSGPKMQALVHERMTGSAVPHLFQRDVKEFVLDVPPLTEQKEIVRLVDQYLAFADTIEAQVKKAQARVDYLTQSILAKAFRGELVPQDPNDEPTDKLLERIAQARKEAEALAKAAKKAEAAKKRAAKSV